MGKSTIAGTVLTMRPSHVPGSWKPSSAEDSRLLRRVQRPRDGDPVNHPDRGKVAYLIALCASRGVRVLFEPDPPVEALPSPAPRSGQGGRRKR